MPWVIANSNEAYDGDTHELAGRTWSGATRTSESRRLEWVDLVVKPKKKRARNKDGTLKADDPSTPEVNEAYEQ